MQIREMREGDISQLGEIEPTTVCNSYLAVEVERGEGAHHTFRLVEREECPPFVKGEGYRYGSAEQQHARDKLAAGHGLMLVVEDEGVLVGAMEVEPSNWNNTATVWNILLSPAARGRGMGRELIARAAAWARQRGYRALMLETQTDNPAACRFYLRYGFQLVGFNTMLYTNHDIGGQEVALFFALPLTEE